MRPQTTGSIEAKAQFVHINSDQTIDLAVEN